MYEKCKTNLIGYYVIAQRHIETARSLGQIMKRGRGKNAHTLRGKKKCPMAQRLLTRKERNEKERLSH